MKYGFLRLFINWKVQSLSVSIFPKVFVAKNKNYGFLHYGSYTTLRCHIHWKYHKIKIGNHHSKNFIIKLKMTIEVSRISTVVAFEVYPALIKPLHGVAALCIERSRLLTTFEGVGSLHFSKEFSTQIRRASPFLQ